MRFIVIAQDGDDPRALYRRLAARAAHIALGDKMKAAGQMLYGVAILDDSEKMIGSILVCEFPSRNDLDSWLKVEPYVTGNVWKKIDIKRCKIGPSFPDSI